jgi:hypothetical protein
MGLSPDRNAGVVARLELNLRSSSNVWDVAEFAPRGERWTTRRARKNVELNVRNGCVAELLLV